MPTIKCVLFLAIALCTTNAAPTAPEPEISTTAKPSTEHDLSQFVEVHDQRQNGTENIKVRLNNIVLLWTPSGALLQGASMLAPALFDGEYPNAEDYFPAGGGGANKPTSVELKPPKPDAPVYASNGVVLGPQTSTPANIKRKFRLPGFMRPLVRRSHQQI